MFLTEEELKTLTGRKNPSSQAKQLRQMGITYKVNGRGKLIVGSAHVEAVLGCDPASREKRKTSPRLELVN